jgi:hypothetical protein
MSLNARYKSHEFILTLLGVVVFSCIYDRTAEVLKARLKNAEKS